MDAIILRTRLRSFIKAHYGPPGLARPQLPIHLWPWRSSLEIPQLAGFVWNIYDDVILPAAIGLRMAPAAALAGFDTVYEVGEWHGPGEIEVSAWIFRANHGWAELINAPRREVRSD